MQASNEQIAIASELQMVVFDVDGVFTDGHILIDHQGNETKKFHVHDGHGVKLLLHYGVDVAVLSARESQAVTVRMRDLGVKDVLQGHIDKRSAFDELLERKNISAQQVAYVGDDIVDLQVMQKVSLPIAVANAQDVVKQHALLITEKSGGHGAVREVSDFILAAKGLLKTALDFNLQP